MRRWLSVLLGIVVLALFTPGIAWAHPQILRTEPAANAQLTTPPSQVRITFNETLEAAFSTVELLNPQGQRVDAGGGGRDSADPASLTLKLPSIGPGVYTVVWQTVGSDGHQVKGNFAFTVIGAIASTPTPAQSVTPGAAPTPTPVASLPVEDSSDTGPPAALIAVLRALMLLGAIAISGGWLSLLVVVLPALGDRHELTRTALLKRWRRNQWIALVGLVVSVGLFAVVETASIADHVDVTSLQALLVTTRIGLALLARLILGALLAGLLATTARLRPWQGWLAGVLSGVLLLTFSLSGHAAAQSAPLLPILADWVHLTASALWVGGLIGLATTLTVLGSSLQGRDLLDVIARVIARFSTFTLGSVVALTASGTYAALLHLQVVSDLWTSAYGLALLTKIVLFGGLLALGAYNMLIMRSRFARWTERTTTTVIQKWRTTLQMTVRSEIILAVLVIGAVGFLTNAAPPMFQAQSAPLAATAVATETIQATATLLPTRTQVASKPFAETKRVEDVEIELRVAPASVGNNTFEISVRDGNGTPFDAQKVVVSVHMLEMDMGATQVDVTPQGAGRYSVPASQLSMIGTWQVKVTVRRADADDVETTFDVPVGG